jgi:glucose/arabinose dehydrogenase
MRLKSVGLGLLAGSALATTAAAEVDVRLEPFVTGLTSPLAMVQPDGEDRMFVIEQDGFVRVVTAEGELLPEPFLDIRGRMVELMSDFDERGLLGLTFHPQFSENGRFYLGYSRPLDPQGDLAKQLWYSHTNVVAEFRTHPDDPFMADPNFEKTISKIDWPQFNHNGHWIGVGPDDHLYISTGDGGYANDWGIGHNVSIGNGQDLQTPMGKMLRLTLDGEVPEDNPFADDFNALPEIWAYGLRNAWRCSFDMGGDNALFCADVGQNSFEEVNIVGAGDNLGWRHMEGNHCFDFENPNDHPASCETAGMVMPILEYKNCTAQPEGCMGISVTGGYVYRGDNADWDGKYIFGDWSKSFASMDGQLFVGSQGDDGSWSMEQANVVNMDIVPYILAFAQDAAGEVYALTSVTTGPVGNMDTIYKVVPAE